MMNRPMGTIIEKHDRIISHLHDELMGGFYQFCEIFCLDNMKWDRIYKNDVQMVRFLTNHSYIVP